jgi:hypothetical protein
MGISHQTQSIGLCSRGAVLVEAQFLVQLNGKFLEKTIRVNFALANLQHEPRLTRIHARKQSLT